MKNKFSHQTFDLVILLDITCIIYDIALLQGKTYVTKRHRWEDIVNNKDVNPQGDMTF